jgi:8-oxo-dGTP pyrophosphatase MutT (NUDIX family)
MGMLFCCYIRQEENSMLHISIQNKPLFLVDKITFEVDDYLHRPTTIFLDELNPAAVKTILQEMENDRFYAGVFLHHNLNELLNAFKEQLNVVPAAGGLVYTPQNDILLIHRLGRWDLPKGKLDDGETLEECAIREIEEETGANGLSIVQPLQVTYHTYHQKGKNNLKESHWFLIKAEEKTKLTPQTEEDVQQCIWVPISDIQPYVDGSFPTIAQVLKQGVSLLQAK